MLKHVLQTAISLGLAASVLGWTDPGPDVEVAPRDQALAHPSAGTGFVSIQALGDRARSSSTVEASAVMEGESDDDDGRQNVAGFDLGLSHQRFATSSNPARIRTRPDSSISLTRLRC